MLSYLFIGANDVKASSAFYEVIRIPSVTSKISPRASISSHYLIRPTNRTPLEPFISQSLLTANLQLQGMG